MLDNLNFETIMDIIKLISLGIGILIVIKQRSEVIIAKYKQRKAEEKADTLEERFKAQDKSFEFIGNTLLKIVQSSKMSTEDKTDVTEEFLRVRNELPERITKVVEENKDVIEDVVDFIGDVKGVASGIINRE